MRIVQERCRRKSRSCLRASIEGGAHEDTGNQGYGNDGPWKTRKTKNRFSIVSHRPWKSLRDSHIPTAAATTARKSGNPKPGFPLSLRGLFSHSKSCKQGFS